MILYLFTNDDTHLLIVNKNQVIIPILIIFLFILYTLKKSIPRHHGFQPVFNLAEKRVETRGTFTKSLYH